MAKLKSISPISRENVSALPVRDLAPAIAYYESVMGFNLLRRDAAAATLQRDGVQLGLVIKLDHKPDQAGSLAFAVDELDALHRELSDRGGRPGEFGIDEWNGKQFRTFFMREDENGYCYCFYCSAEKAPTTSGGA